MTKMRLLQKHDNEVLHVPTSRDSVRVCVCVCVSVAAATVSLLCVCVVLSPFFSPLCYFPIQEERLRCPSNFLQWVSLSGQTKSHSNGDPSFIMDE